MEIAIAISTWPFPESCTFPALHFSWEVYTYGLADNSEQSAMRIKENRNIFVDMYVPLTRIWSKFGNRSAVYCGKFNREYHGGNDKARDTQPKI
jgi:hypothetical protein